MEILLFLTFSAIYSVFLFFRALKKIWFFFQSNVKFSLTYSHSLCLSIPSIDQLTLNGGPQRKSRDSKCVDTNQKWENFQELPSLPFCFVTVVFLNRTFHQYTSRIFTPFKTHLMKPDPVKVFLFIQWKISSLMPGEMFI